MHIYAPVRTLVTVLLALSATACARIVDTAGESPRAADTLIGCYEQSGLPGASLRVSARSGDYRLQSMGSTNPVEVDRTLVEAIPEQVAHLLSTRSASVESMILDVDGVVFLLKLQQGTAIEGMMSETGHYLGTPMGGQPLRPVPCPD